MCVCERGSVGREQQSGKPFGVGRGFLLPGSWALVSLCLTSRIREGCWGKLVRSKMSCRESWHEGWLGNSMEWRW